MRTAELPAFLSVAGKLFTLADDPFLPRGLGSKYCDGDGFPAKKREIFRDLGRYIFITGYIGGNSNSTTGDFSVGIIGKLYEKGVFVQNVYE